MDKHSKRSASIFRYPVLIAFTLFFAGLFLLDLVTPDRAYSELAKTRWWAVTTGSPCRAPWKRR